MKVAAVLLGALLAAQSAQAQDPTAIVGRASRAYRALSSLKADFLQTIQDRSLGDTLTSAGTVVQAGNNFFAMRFSDPAGEAVVVDGKYIWTYTPSTAPDVVYRRPVPTDPVYGVNLLALLLDRPENRYRATYVTRDTVQGRPADVIDLEPVSQSVPFARARIWLSVADALPRRIELDEAPGARRIIELRTLRPNAPTPRGTFTFEVPPGVRVLADPRG